MSSLQTFLHNWRQDLEVWARHDAPKLLVVLLLAFLLVRLLRAVTGRLIEFTRREPLPSGLRARQLRTLSSVLYSVGAFLIVFLALMQVLPLFGVNIQPLLASAGIAGLAIGFGAQTLVKDVINGFFILMENQYDLGDVVRVGGVQGTVEQMSLRRTMLRDTDGAVHVVPNSEIKIVSNLTRDWTQVSLHVAVDYNEESDRVLRLLEEVGRDFYADAKFAGMLVAQPEVPGIERVAGREVDYLMLVKVRPGEQFAVSRELRRRIKDCLAKNNVQPGGPTRVYVADTQAGKPPVEVS